MSPSTKSLLIMWTSSLLTFGVLAFYMLPRQEEINVPGELGENFATGALFVLIALSFASVGVSFFTRKK